MTLVLGLDCSGETYSVGLWSSSGLSLEASGQQPRRALRELPQAISYLLATAGVKADQLSALGVTQGPGSFTGVRLGVTVAKTVALVARCPVRGWDTLELLARQHLPRGSTGTVAVALDARRSELYCALFEQKAEGEWHTLLPTSVRSPVDFQTELARRDAVHVAVGTGFQAYPTLLEPSWTGPRWQSRRDSAPSGLVVAELTGSDPSGWGDAAALVPVYHRRADIQVQPGAV